jgi:uncharacterized membrane protein YeaQ/YmgE (transglycosylase-associated protein family)
VFYILSLLFIGLIAGAIARLFVGSPERLGCLGTAALGVIGSYAGGSLWAILFYNHFDLRKASTFFGSVIGSILILLVWRFFDRVGSRRHR